MKEVLRLENVALEELEDISKRILPKLYYSVVLLNGAMGAGKTTLMGAICKNMGTEDHVSSPTYSIVNQYKTNEGDTIYHFDCYRLEDELEALDIGIQDYLYSGDYCFVEWPSMINNLLPEQCMEIEIVVKDDYLRDIVIREHGERSI